MRTSIIFTSIVLALNSFAGEVTNEVKTVVVKMMCDTPGCDGEMRQGGYILTSNPPQYPHTCTVCKTNRTFLTCYPELRNEPLKSKLEKGYIPYFYGTNTIGPGVVTKETKTTWQYYEPSFDEKVMCDAPKCDGIMESSGFYNLSLPASSFFRCSACKRELDFFWIGGKWIHDPTPEQFSSECPTMSKGAMLTYAMEPGLMLVSTNGKMSIIKTNIAIGSITNNAMSDLKSEMVTNIQWQYDAYRAEIVIGKAQYEAAVAFSKTNTNPIMSGYSSGPHEDIRWSPDDKEIGFRSDGVLVWRTPPELEPKTKPHVQAGVVPKWTASYATNNQKELFNWHDKSRPSNWYDWIKTVVTNWATIGTYTPLNGTSEEVQRGTTQTNVTATIEWKGIKKEFILESTTGSDVGERRVPKPNQWLQRWYTNILGTNVLPYYYYSCPSNIILEPGWTSTNYYHIDTNSNWSAITNSVWIGHIESNNMWLNITNSPRMYGTTNSTIPSVVTNNVTQLETFYGPTEAGTLWQTDGRGNGYWVTNGIVKVDGSGTEK